MALLPFLTTGLMHALVVIYRCPHCNGNIKIGGETEAKALKFCNYCGKAIDTTDLVDYLKAALSS